MARDAQPNTDTLEKIFHEPNRLAIVSAVCGAPDGITFPELKSLCGLTDGNLNRHLKVLDEARVIRIDKRFVDARPRTTIYLSKTGLKRFQEYLAALEDVLRTAQAALPVEEKRKAPSPLARPAEA